MTTDDLSSIPLITVGLPVFNGEGYLRGALDSLLAQDHNSFEIVISDNGSTDGTVAICNEYASKDPRIRLFVNDINRGAAWNFNEVVRHARGRYFMWAAHDDLWKPDCLSLYVDALEQCPDAVLVYGRAVPIGRAGQPVGEPSRGFANEGATAVERVRHLLKHWELHVAIYGMYRTEVLRRTRLILPRISCEIIFLVEIAIQGKTVELAQICCFQRVPDPGENYRSIDEQLTYLDPTARGKNRFSSFVLTAKTMEFLRSTDLISSPRERAALLYECTRAYLADRILLDIKQEIVRYLAPNPNVLSQLRTIYRTVHPRRAHQ